MTRDKVYGLTPKERQYVAEVDAGIVKGDAEFLLGLIYELDEQVKQLLNHLSPPPQEKVLNLERDF